jgi:hypothetical protein
MNLKLELFTFKFKMKNTMKDQLHKAFPSKGLDLNKAIDIGSIAWTNQIMKSLLEIALKIKKEGHTRDARTFTPLGFNKIGQGFDSKYSVQISRNWTPAYIKGKLKSKLSELVIYNIQSYSQKKK